MGNADADKDGTISKEEFKNSFLLDFWYVQTLYHILIRQNLS